MGAVCFRRFETAVAERRSFEISVASVFEDVFGGDSLGTLMRRLYIDRNCGMGSWVSMVVHN